MAEENIYPVTIPEYTDSADIRKAFYRYHYGTDDAVTSPSEIQPNSMAKYLDDTIRALNSAQDRLGSISLLGSNVNLNDLTSAAQVGIYQSIDSPTTALNYPVQVRGLLSVVLAESSPGSIAQNTVYQTYQTQSTTETNNEFYWRSGIFNTATNNYSWSPWARASKVGHTHAEYAEINTLNSKVDISIGASPVNPLSTNRALVTDSAGKIVPSSTVTAAQIAYLGDFPTGGTNQSIKQQIDGKAASAHTHDDRYYGQQSFASTAGVRHTARVWVQAQEPPASNPADATKAAAIGDLWFW